MRNTGCHYRQKARGPRLPVMSLDNMLPFNAEGRIFYKNILTIHDKLRGICARHMHMCIAIIIITRL